MRYKIRALVLAIICFCAVAILAWEVQAKEDRSQYDMFSGGRNDPFDSDSGTYWTVRHIDDFHMENMESDHDLIIDLLTEIEPGSGSDDAQPWEKIVLYDDFQDSCLEPVEAGCEWLMTATGAAALWTVPDAYHGILNLNASHPANMEMALNPESIPFKLSKSPRYSTYIALEGSDSVEASWGIGDNLGFYINHQWGQNIHVRANGGYQQTSAIIDDSWHLYDIMVANQTILFYMDSELIWEYPWNGTDSAHYPSYYLESGVMSGCMSIDYVYVEQNRV